MTTSQESAEPSAARRAADAGPGGAASVWRGGHGRLTLGLVATTLLIAFEAMAVATAMPVAVRDLRGLRFYALAFGAFMAANMFATVLSGLWSDRAGPVRPLSAGLATFGGGLLLAGLAPGMGVFALGRAVQGIGAGLIIVALYVVVAQAYPEKSRPRVFATLAGAWVVPAIVGPTAAGLITEHFGWRWVFLGILPVIVAPVLLMLPTMRRLRPAGQDVADTSSATRRPGRLRLALAAAVGMALFQYGGAHVSAVGLACLGLAAVLVLPTVPRLLPPGSLRGARGLPSAVISRGLLAGAFFGAESFLPLMLITRRGLTPTAAGVCLTCSAVTWCAGSWFQGRPSTRIARPRLVGLGGALVAAGVGGAALAVWPALPPYVAAIAWAFAGLGMGVGVTSASVLVIEQSAPGEAGANSAALQVADSVGTLIGIGVGGVVFAAGSGAGGGEGGGGAPAGGSVFVTIFLLMVVLAGLCALVGPRSGPNASSAAQPEPGQS